eukprot:1961344-Pleurochrysis_carterae.AAC.1
MSKEESRLKRLPLSSVPSMEVLLYFLDLRCLPAVVEVRPREVGGLASPFFWDPASLIASLAHTPRLASTTTRLQRGHFCLKFAQFCGHGGRIKLLLVVRRVARVLALNDGAHLLHDSHSILESSDGGLVLENVDAHIRRDVHHVHDGLREGRSVLLELDGQLLVKLHEFLYPGVPFGKIAMVGRFLRLEGVDLATSVLDASHVAANCRLVLEAPVSRWSVIAMKTIQLAEWKLAPSIVGDALNDIAVELGFAFR